MAQDMTLNLARRLVAATLKAARKSGLKPMAVAVLDDRACVRMLVSEDGTGLRLPQIAIGKANAALSVGTGTRTIANAALARPHFVPGVALAAGGSFVSVPGGVLIRNRRGHIVGAVGVTGDTADNDEKTAVAGITDLGLTADPGE